MMSDFALLGLNENIIETIKYQYTNNNIRIAATKRNVIFLEFENLFKLAIDFTNNDAILEKIYKWGHKC